MPPKTSLVMIVRDEEAFLGECLQSARAAVDEIVVVDTGSVDGTVATAEALADVVGHFTWCDDFSAARNYALSLATGDWVLTLDADERIMSPDTARAQFVSFATEAQPNTIGAVRMVQPVRHGGQEQVVTEPLPRFFPRADFRYVGTVHEQLVSDVGTPGVVPCGVEVFHRGYALEAAASDAKSRRNLHLLRAALLREPENGYLQYQMGKTFFALRRYGMAAIYLRQAWDALRGGGLGELAPSILTDLATLPAYALVNEDKADEAEDVLAEHVLSDHAGTRGADFPHTRGYVALLLGHYDRAERLFQAARDCGVEAELVAGTGTYTAAYHLGLLREARGQLAEALEHYADSLRLNPTFLSPALRAAALTAQAVDEADAVFGLADAAVAAVTVAPALEEAGDTDDALAALRRAWVKSFEAPFPLS